ncbi:MAG: DnaJ domain-containing protein [bacterium]|nr:DnaJ domain-containing protein [bacterium]
MAENSNTNTKQNYIYQAYLLLNVSPGDSTEKIREEYLKLARTFHPDRLSANPAAQAEAAEKMKEINSAYSLIKHAPLYCDDPRFERFARRARDEEESDHRPTKRRAGFFETLSHFMYGTMIGAGFSIFILLGGLALCKNVLNESAKLGTVISYTYILIGATIFLSGLLAAIFKTRFYKFIARPILRKYQR